MSDKCPDEGKLQSENVYLRRKLKGVKMQRAEVKRQLAQANATIARVYRQCDSCGSLVHGTPDHPCDKCGSLKGTGIEVAWAERDEQIKSLRAVVEKQYSAIMAYLEWEGDWSGSSDTPEHARQLLGHTEAMAVAAEAARESTDG